MSIHIYIYTYIYITESAHRKTHYIAISKLKTIIKEINTILSNLYISKDILHKSKKQAGLQNNTITAPLGQAKCNVYERKSTFISPIKRNGWYIIEGEHSLQLASHQNSISGKRTKKRRPTHDLNI